VTDVIVVGGGIIGTACAYELAHRGIGVTLVERGELAAGASGRNHGLLVVPLDPVLGPMAAHSTASYEEIAGQAPWPIGLDPERIGFLIVAGHDEEERAAGKAEADAAAACGVEVELLEDAALHSLEPALSPDLSAGWLLEDARRLNPASLTVSLAHLARERGARILTHVTARAVLVEHGAARGVLTDDGSIRSDAVVVAAGPWSAGLLRPLGIRVPVSGARGWLVHLAPGVAPTTRLIGRAGWHLLSGERSYYPPDAGEVGTSFPGATVGTLLHPNPDGTMLAGGSRQSVITSEPEDASVPRDILRGAIAVFPSLADATVLSAWWGIRPVTRDDRPIIGPVADDLFVATGHGSQGVILGGGTARLAASLMTGEPPPFDPGPFAPSRFA
jgi:sarcosine oxidase subunit beta